jgi:hypothetical protein
VSTERSVPVSNRSTRSREEIALLKAQGKGVRRIARADIVTQAVGVAAE